MQIMANPMSKYGVALLIVVVLVCGMISSAIYAAGPEVTVSITPDTIQIARQDKAVAFVLVKNESDALLEDIKLDFDTDTDLKISVEDSAQGVKLPPGATHRWKISVEAPESGQVSGQIYLLIDYNYLVQGESNGRQDTSQVAGTSVASVKVESIDAVQLDEIVTLEIKNVSANFVEFQPRTIHLVVTNNSEEVITVTNVLPLTPSFLTLTPIFTQEVTLRPRLSHVFATTSSVSSQAKPGKQLILFDVFLKGSHDGRNWEANTIKSLEVEVGIFGESELLSLLSNSLPGDLSILTLPGLLFLLTLGALWRWRNPGSSFLKDIKNLPEILVIATFLSLIVVFSYPNITERFGPRRDLLQARGFLDIAILWIGSILAAIIVIALIKLWDLVVASRDYVFARGVINQDDKELAVLNKLAKFHKLDFPSVKIDDKMYLATMPAYRDKTQVWCVPQILYTVDTAKPEGGSLYQRLLDADSKRQFDEVLKLVKEGTNAEVLTLSFGSNGKPRRIDRAIVSGNDERLIREDKPP